MFDGHDARTEIVRNRTRRNEAFRRGLLCLVVFLATAVLVSLQDRFTTNSLRGFVFDLMHRSWPGLGLPFGGPQTIHGYMLAPVLLVTVIVTLPVFAYQGLAFATRRPHNAGHLMLKTVAVSAAFALGLAVAYRLLLPAYVAYRMRWDPLEITIMWITDYLYETLAVLLGGGLIAVAPVLWVFLVVARRKHAGHGDSE